MKAILWILMTFITARLCFGGGSWVDTSFVAPSLGFSNQVRIYLPEGYDPQGTIDYSAIYFLHGLMAGGSPGHTEYSGIQIAALDSLISSGLIDPVIVVKPNGSCPPYDGSCWANSELNGDYEDYVVYDLVDFIESNYRVSTEPVDRCIAGHSMGGSGAMDISLRHPDLYRAVASHSGNPDLQTSCVYWIPRILWESPQSEPPYTYDWGNGDYTNFTFTYAGAHSPNLSAPDSINFILDENGGIVDSVYAEWELHNPAHMVKLIPTLDLAIFFDCGDDDPIVGISPANYAYSDTLTELGIEHVYQNLPGIGHDMNQDRFIQELLFLQDAMTGISTESRLRRNEISSVIPNPFSTVATVVFDVSSGYAQLDIYDLSGRLVETLVDEPLAAGEHSTILNGQNLASGLYLIRLVCDSQTSFARVVLLR